MAPSIIKTGRCAIAMSFATFINTSPVVTKAKTSNKAANPTPKAPAQNAANAVKELLSFLFIAHENK